MHRQMIFHLLLSIGMGSRNLTVENNIPVCNCGETKDYYSTGRANPISCAVGLR